MENADAREAIGTRVVRNYERYGLLWGLAFGLLVGVLLSGPHFYEWSAGFSLAVIFGSVVISAGIGWLAAFLAVGSVAGGNAWGAGFYGGADGSGDGGSSDCGSGGGDGGACS
jgi:hypothetical protein